MALNLEKARKNLQAFDFASLFTELGWEKGSPVVLATLEVAQRSWEMRRIAELGKVRVVELSPLNGHGLPDAETRVKLHDQITRGHFGEHLMIALDKPRDPATGATPRAAEWSWQMPGEKKLAPRVIAYSAGMTGDSFLSRITSIFFDFNEYAAGDANLLNVLNRLKAAFDIEKVTKGFYGKFKDQHTAFLDAIDGIDDERDRRWYASILLNRLMFIWFLQKKNFLDHGNGRYLTAHLENSAARFGNDNFYRVFLRALFFEGFAKPATERGKGTPDAYAAGVKHLGTIPYLNGGLFVPHRIETDYPDIQVKDAAFHALLGFGDTKGLFGSYEWNLGDGLAGEDDDTISPHVLGYIFEKYINQKAFGAYYTRPEITEYLCRQTIGKLLTDRLRATGQPWDPIKRDYSTLDELIVRLDAPTCKLLAKQILPSLALLDPACGSGAFLVAALGTLFDVYSALVGWVKTHNDAELTQWLQELERGHRTLNYAIKRRIITDNIFGVDIMEEACEIARLRLFLMMVSSANKVEELEPLPNIEFNILTGNSLVGLLSVSPSDYDRPSHQAVQMTLQRRARSYQQLVDDKNNRIAIYKGEGGFNPHQKQDRDAIDAVRREGNSRLNQLLLEDFAKAGIKFEQATWDDAKGKEGKPEKRSLRPDDIAALQPFHWGYEFDRVMARGGFDAIIANPPWEVFQAEEKEFFQHYFADDKARAVIEKNKIRLEDWKKEFKTYMRIPELREAWLDFASSFGHPGKWFKASPDYAHNAAFRADGSRIPAKINLYMLFIERCFRLLRSDGECGIVTPSGIYTDLGAKGLREMLFGETEVTGLFCFENRKTIFEGVDSRFKFVVLTFRKGGKTQEFPAAFMRHDVAELERFPQRGSIAISTELIARLSPDSLSVMEFKSPLDIEIAQKMLRFPLLGERIDGTWNVSLSQEFNMTTDHGLFKTRPGAGRLPLYEGKMIHQFTTWAVQERFELEPELAAPKYWLDEKEARQKLLGKRKDTGQTLDYQNYRLAFRAVARNTDERTMIATVLPKAVFAGNSALVADPIDNLQSLCVVALVNSPICDWLLRGMMSANVNMFYIYQLAVPRLGPNDSAFWPIVERAANLICVTEEYDDLAREVEREAKASGVKLKVTPATTALARAKLRAELDGLVAHLYGLSEAEFIHILATFPIVPEATKAAVLEEYRRLAADNPSIR